MAVFEVAFIAFVKATSGDSKTFQGSLHTDFTRGHRSTVHFWKLLILPMLNFW